jgi:hypothetical protein
LSGFGWLGLIGLLPILQSLLGRGEGSGGSSDGGLLGSLLGKFKTLLGGLLSGIPGAAGGGPGLPDVGDVGGGSGGGSDSEGTWSSSDIPQLDEGGDITQTGLAVVHAGESVGPTDASGGSGGGSVLGSTQSLLAGFGKLTSSLGQANPALATLGTGASTASSALELLKSGLSLATSLIGGGGGGSGGGAGGLLGGASSAVGLIGGIAKLFAFDKGGVVTETGLAMVHQEEMILPKPISQGFQALFANTPTGSGPPPGAAEGPQSLGQLLGLVRGSSVGSADRAVSSVPRFELGAWEIDRNMLGMLEQGEAVLPRPFAEGLRSTTGAGGGNGGGNGGDTHNHYYSGDTHNITAFDGHDVQRVLMQHGPTIAKSLARQGRNSNPNARR